MFEIQRLQARAREASPVAASIGCSALLVLTAIAAFDGGVAVAQPASPSPLAVVRDTGSTVPAGQYLSFALEAIDSPEVSPLVHFPVVSTRLAAGEFAASSLRLPNNQLLPQPLFVIGDDERSKAWLKQWSRALIQLGALGFVVNVADADGFKALMRLADGVRLSPSDGTWLQDQLGAVGATSYPLIVLTNGQISATPALTVSASVPGEAR